MGALSAAAGAQMAGTATPRRRCADIKVVIVLPNLAAEPNRRRVDYCVCSPRALASRPGHPTPCGSALLPGNVGRQG